MKPIYYGEKRLHQGETNLLRGKGASSPWKSPTTGETKFHQRETNRLRENGASSPCSRPTTGEGSFIIVQPSGPSSPIISCSARTCKRYKPKGNLQTIYNTSLIPCGKLRTVYNTSSVMCRKLRTVYNTSSSLCGKLRTIYNTSSIPCKKLRNLRNMIHALFGKRYRKGCETSGLAYLYDPGRLWLLAGRNGHNWP